MTALLEGSRVASVGEADNNGAVAREGTDLRRRREALGVTARQFTSLTGINRGTLTNVEEGTARGVSVGAVRAALERLEHEMGVDLPAAEDAPDTPDLVEFEIEGAGFRVVVRGPVKDQDDLQKTVRSLLEGLRADESP